MLQICVQLFTMKIFRRRFPANISMFKVSNRNATKRYEICSKLTIKNLEQRQWRCFSICIVNFEHIITSSSSVSSIDFEQVNVTWVKFNFSIQVQAEA